MRRWFPKSVSKDFAALSKMTQCWTPTSKVHVIKKKTFSEYFRYSKFAKRWIKFETNVCLMGITTVWSISCLIIASLQVSPTPSASLLFFPFLTKRTHCKLVTCTKWFFFTLSRYSRFNWIELIASLQVTHWHNPQFHAYFPTANSYPAILADILSDAIGCIGFSWVSSVLYMQASALTMIGQQNRKTNALTPENQLAVL